MKSTYAAIFLPTLILVADGVEAQTHLDASAIDQAVIAKLSTQFGINSKVVTHLDLTQPFRYMPTLPSTIPKSAGSLNR